MKIIKGFAFAIIVLVLASMFTSCETVAQGIYNGVEAWRNEYFGD